MFLMFLFGWSLISFDELHLQGLRLGHQRHDQDHGDFYAKHRVHSDQDPVENGDS